VIHASPFGGRVKSRFANLYRQQLQSWANELQAYCDDSDLDTLIVAISRKGPRLIELLVHEGFLPQSFKNRVISELALPFVTDCQRRLLLVDDSVSHGTTFLKIRQLASQILPSSELISLPFAIGKEISSNCKAEITNYFLSLDRSEIAPFVNNEALAFHFLGKPFDLEHPICCIEGGFSSKDELMLLLQRVAEKMNAEIIPLETQVPSSSAPLTKYSWTLLFNSNSNIPSITEPAFCKVRFSVQPGTSKLYLTAMQPISIALQDDYLNKIKNALPRQLSSLWDDIHSSAEDRKEKLYQGLEKEEFQQQIDDAFTRSICMWASHLNSFLLLSNVKKVLEETYLAAVPDKRITFSQSFEDDLRYLIGRDFTPSASRILQDFWSDSDYVNNHTIQPFIWDYSSANEEEIIMPAPYKGKYSEGLNSLKKQFEGQEGCDIETALRGILYAQHLVEVASRKSPNNNHNRLDFGVTYKGLEEEVKSLVKRPIVSRDFNYYLDKLIDEGCIVPRYINMSIDTNPFWVRAFRGGESPSEKRKDFLRKTFTLLEQNLRDFSMPVSRQVLEELFAIAFSPKKSGNFTDISAIPDLVGFSEFDVGYEPGGIICYFSEDPKSRESIFAWACRRQVFIINEQTSQVSLYDDSQLEDQGGVDSRAYDRLSFFVELFVKILTYQSLDQIAGSRFLSYLAAINPNSEFQKVVFKRLEIWRRNFDKEIFPVNGSRDCNNLKKLSGLCDEVQEYIAFNHVLNSPCMRFISSFSQSLESPENRRISRALSETNLTLWRVLAEAAEEVAFEYQDYRGTNERKLSDLLETIPILTNVAIGLLNPDFDTETLLTSLQNHFQNVNDDSSQDRDVLRKLQISNNISFETIQFILEEWFMNRLSRLRPSIEVPKISEKNDVSGYFLKWDVIASTDSNIYDIVEALERINKTSIVYHLYPALRSEFHELGSPSDGYGCICESIQQILEIYGILTNFSRESLPNGFRFGCVYERFSKGKRPSDVYTKAYRFMRAFDSESVNCWWSQRPVELARDKLILSQEVHSSINQDTSLLQRYGLEIEGSYEGYNPKGYPDSNFNVYVISRVNNS
jgi:hypothetical protein